jgi:adenylate cyclase
MMALCPENPLVYVGMGSVYQAEAAHLKEAGESALAWTEKGIALAQKALSMDNSSAAAHGLLGHLYLVKGEYDKAVAEGERAVSLAPGFESAHTSYAFFLYCADRPEEAIPEFQTAIRLSPLGSTSTYLHLGSTYWLLGRFDEAVTAFKKALQLSPNNAVAHLGLAATYSILGREKEARTEAAEVLRLYPKFSVDISGKKIMHKNRKHVEMVMNAWRKTGLK